ncbi:MAG: RHS repeat-associated core domain-containing protein, partial [Limnohabitans sp.]|nr:RHS repeat-associated core domain-containing protein [Limnohabitans sp.]
SSICSTCKYKPFYSLNYVFNYTDHLGNVRVSYAQENGTLKILEENSYYPFGLKHTRTNINSKMFVESAGKTSIQTIGELTPYTTYFKNNYKYNGKELQDELGLNMYDYGARNYDPAIGRWMNIDPKAEKMRKYSPYTYAWDNPVIFVDYDGMFATPPTDFYNLKGQLTKHVEDGKTDKKIVLTTSKKEADTDTAISNGHVVNQITNDQLEKMDEIYAFGKTDKTGTEKGFMFGEKGKSSKIVTGKEAGTIGSKQWNAARIDLGKQGDTVASDAHLHPLEYDTEGNVVIRGLPTPSEGTGNDTDPKNMEGNTQPSMILGWSEVKGRLPDGQMGGTPPPSTYTPTVGFYNTGGSIITIDYSTFKKGMQKVNK